MSINDLVVRGSTSISLHERFTSLRRGGVTSQGQSADNQVNNGLYNRNGFDETSPGPALRGATSVPNYTPTVKMESLRRGGYFRSDVPSRSAPPPPHYERYNPETNTHGRPVSVVAPTNTVKQKTSQEFNRDQPLFVSPVTSRPPEMKNMSSVACNQQQQQRISIQEINKQLNNIDIQEPTSVSVSKWLQTLPNHLDSSSSNPNINSSLKEKDSNPENVMYDQNKPIIKEIVLVNHELHIFNLYKQPYVISAEVSCLFPKWKKKDHLSKMIKLKKLNIPSLEICRASENHEVFFEQCLIEDVAGIETSDGDLTDSVTLYPMESIQNMLSLFGASGGLSLEDISRLSKAIKKEYNSFNPNDKFWSSCI